VDHKPLDELIQQEPVLALCGPSGSGKTTLLEQVIPILRQRGLAVAVVKHDVHGIKVDPPGKDSARLFAAGADVVLRGPGESLWRRHQRGEHDLHTALLTLLAEHDLVLVEGHKSSPLPKLWVAGNDQPTPPAGVEAVIETLASGDSRTERLLAFLDRWLPDVWSRRRLLAGILIGGNATRMGSPKQLLTFRGQTLVEGVRSALEPHVDQIVLLGAGDCPQAVADAPRLPDVAAVRGPLAGMLAALRWAPRAAWIVAACDLPLANPDAVAWLKAQRQPGRWAILPQVSERGIEPLLALYEPQARPLLEDVVARGRAGPRLISHHHAVVSPSPPSELTGAWFNVNTPQDLASLGNEADEEDAGG
jgi:molybdopterin-guanine dinucleotide biosynthesis protein MobB